MKKVLAFGLFASFVIMSCQRGEIWSTEEFREVSQEEVKELEKYRDFAFGKVGSEKYIYLFTDPDCEPCKEAEGIVEKWAMKKGVEVRVILFPSINELAPICNQKGCIFTLLPRSEAVGKAVSLICDKKGWEEYKRGYNSKNQCKAGKKKIESNLKLGEEYGIEEAPTFIGMNGRVYAGVPTEQDLDKLIQ
jgi:thiol:disulfide interchange protein DsbC